MIPTQSISSQRRPLVEFLYAAGYSRELLRLEFPVPHDGQLSRVDVAAFARAAPVDMTTLTVAGHVVPSDGSPGDALDAARSLAAPIALIRTNGRLELWRVAARSPDDQRIGDGDANEARELAGRFASVVDPEAVFAAKHGRQLTLFPVDAGLLAHARQGSSDRLSVLVDEAMATLLAQVPLALDGWKDAARLVVRTLAALVIRDKFELDVSGVDVFWAAEQRFPAYFGALAQLSDERKALLASVADILGRGVNYRGLDPSVVSRVYENAVVTAAARIEQGIYYTPPGLADRIVATLPFEQLPPERRVVLDPACGSGTLLIAAHDRLAELLPVQSDGGNQHGYLVAHLVGYDADPFATEIASLALLLHSLPFGNHWHVEQRDALQEGRPDVPPSIVVSNPPWRGRRSVGRHRVEESIAFLHRMVQLCEPGGFVASVLPASWLQSDVARQSREWLRSRASIFEIWRLPEGTFESAALAPCVVFAQVQEARAYPWVYRRVRPHSVQKFMQTYRADEQWLQAESDEATRTLMRGPFDSIEVQLKELRILSDIADVETSPVPEPGKAIGERGDFKLLPKARELTAYGSPDPRDLIPVRYPDDFHRTGRERGPRLRERKVLVSARRSPANPWRLKVGLDDIGVIPRESLHIVTPRDTANDEGLFALLALLGSRMASAWIDAYEPKRTIDIALLRAFPVPPPGAIWGVLTDAGRRLHGAAGTAEIGELAAAIDALIESAYGVPEALRRSLDRAFGGTPAPEGTIRYPAQPVDESGESGSLNLFGAVLSVGGGTLRLWVPGVTPDDGTEMELPVRFPGWLCREGSTFDIVGSTDLMFAEYRFQARSWLEIEPERFDDRPEESR